MKAYGQVKNTENLMSTSLENNVTAALIGSTNTETLTSITSQGNNFRTALKWSNNTENLTSKSLGNNITAMLTGRKCSRMSTVDEFWRASEFTNLYLEDIFAKFLFKKQSSLAPPLCLPLFIVCFRRFPAAPLQLRPPAPTKNYFLGLYCGETHPLRPSKTTFRHESWPERHLPWEKQWHDVCKSRPAHGNTMKNISKTKGTHGASFASYYLEKVDDKGQRAIRQKNASGGMKGNGARDKRETRTNISREQ